MKFDLQISSLFCFKLHSSDQTLGKSFLNKAEKTVIQNVISAPTKYLKQTSFLSELHLPQSILGCEPCR